MTYKEILNNSKKDYEIHIDDLVNEPNNSAMRHIKYIELFLKHKEELDKLEIRQKLLVRKLSEYYSGQGDPEIYKQKKPFLLKLRTTQIDSYVKSDEEYIALEKEMKECGTLIMSLELIVEKFKWRDKAIAIMLDYEKFINGR